MFEIGYSLRSARERQGLDLPEVELATKIRAKYIRAIEEDDFDSLPGDAYTRGFLRTYAEYLGLDGQTYVDEYASRFLSSRHDEPPSGRRGAACAAASTAIERRAVLLALVGIAAIAALVFAAWRYGGKPTNVPRPRQRAAADGLDALEASSCAAWARGRTSSSAANTASGQVLLQGTVSPGEIDRLPGTRFYLLVRSPGNLHVKLGGRAVALPAVHNLQVLVTPQRTTRLVG